MEQLFDGEQNCINAKFELLLYHPSTAMILLIHLWFLIIFLTYTYTQTCVTYISFILSTVAAWSAFCKRIGKKWCSKYFINLFVNFNHSSYLHIDWNWCHIYFFHSQCSGHLKYILKVNEYKTEDPSLFCPLFQI